LNLFTGGLVNGITNAGTYRRADYRTTRSKYC